MRINWRKLASNIPPHIRISSKTVYEVLFIKQFDRKDTWGETRFKERQIILKKGLTNKQLVETFYHECLHALSDEHGLNLSEEQVINSESTLPYIMKLVELLEGKN